MRKLMSVVAVAAALTLSVTPAMAADTAPQVPAAVEISPAKRALLERLDKAMNFERLMNQTMSAAMKGTLDNMRQMFPELSEEKTKTLTDAAVTVSARYLPKMKEITFQAYGEVLSDAELTAMVEFYESPEGQAILNKVPEITQRSMGRMQPLMLDMQKDMFKAMCADTECPKVLLDRLK